MTQDKVMLLIDADNVSLDVIEQAVGWVGKHFGGPHVRRAYCTAESAVKHQAAFKRLSIRPMVNLAAGKNSTDIALAVDAIDLTLAERPDVVVIASSDSDFAPLVSRLREKGCRLIGIGQQGKTGDETRAVYDDYEVMEHRKAPPGARGEGRADGRGSGRGDGRGEARGAGRGESRGESRGEGRGESRRQGRGAGRGDLRTAVQADGLVEGRDARRDRGRAQRKGLEPAPNLLEPPPSDLASDVLHEAPVAQPAPKTPPVPAGAPAEKRPARPRSRGRRKPLEEAVMGAVPGAMPGATAQTDTFPASPEPLVERAVVAVPTAAQPEPPPAPKPVREAAPEPVHEPVPEPAQDLAAELTGAQAKPARKPRRRRPSAAKRLAEAGPGSLP